MFWNFQTSFFCHCTGLIQETLLRYFSTRVGPNSTLIQQVPSNRFALNLSAQTQVSSTSIFESTARCCNPRTMRFVTSHPFLTAGLWVSLSLKLAHVPVKRRSTASNRFHPAARRNTWKHYGSNSSIPYNMINSNVFKRRHPFTTRCVCEEIEMLTRNIIKNWCQTSTQKVSSNLTLVLTKI